MLRALIQDFNWLWDELKVRSREVGFSGNTRDIVRHALELLGDKLVQVETPSQGRFKNDDECDLAFVKANLELPQVLEVSYYSNVALSAFLGDAIVGEHTAFGDFTLFSMQKSYAVKAEILMLF